MREQVWELDTARIRDDWEHRERLCAWLLAQGVPPAMIPASTPLYVTQDDDGLTLHGEAIVPPDGAKPTESKYGPVYPIQLRPGTLEILTERSSWSVTSLPPVD